MNILAELQKKALANAQAKGWFHQHRDEPGALEKEVPKALAHLHSEVSEIYEEYRIAPTPAAMADIWVQTGALQNRENILELAEQGYKPLGPASEVADVLIQLLELTAWLGIDLDRAVKIKMAYNATRPANNGKVR